MRKTRLRWLLWRKVFDIRNTRRTKGAEEEELFLSDSPGRGPGKRFNEWEWRDANGQRSQLYKRREGAGGLTEGEGLTGRGTRNTLEQSRKERE